MIQAANSSNLAEVTKLAGALWPNHGFEALKEEMQEILLSKSALIALYFQNEVPIAFAQCQLRNDYVEGTQSSPVGYLEGIYVDENHRKMGIAKQLLLYCQQWAAENDCVEFASDCEMDNVDSYRFHLAAGFIEANRIICFSKKI